MSYNQLLRSRLRKSEIPGEVGIEIELEGKNINQYVFRYWSVHNEESLVGDDSIEFVLRFPVLRNEVQPALELIKRNISRASLDDSYRTSVHIHINILNSKFYQLANYITLYYILEEVLFTEFSPLRRGNHFCLRYSESDKIERFLVALFRDEDLHIGDAGRYAAINLAAIRKYGSLEFRNFPGISQVFDIDNLKRYIDILLKIKDVSHIYKNPHKIYWDFVEDPKNAFLKVFSDYPEIEYNKDLVFEGLRNITALINHLDWDEIVKAKEKKTESEDDEAPKPVKSKPKKPATSLKPQVVSTYATSPVSQQWIAYDTATSISLDEIFKSQKTLSQPKYFLYEEDQ